MVRMVALAALALVPALGCVVRRAPPSPAAPSGPPRPVFNNCLLGTSLIESRRHQSFGPGHVPGPVTEDGSCHIGAACVAEQGRSVPGDGSVGMTCEKGECICELEPYTPPKDVVTFRFAATCWTRARAEELMREHCLNGMHMAPPPPSPYPPEYVAAAASDDLVTVTDGIEYSTFSGRDLGGSIHEREMHLRVDLGRGTADLERHQPSADWGGEALGSFRSPLTSEDAEQLRALIAAAPFEPLDSDAPDTALRGVVEIRRIQAGMVVETRIDAGHRSVLRRLRSLLNKLDIIAEDVAHSPLRAIEIQLEPNPLSGAFSAKVRNVGRKAVALPDLLELARASGADPHHWFGVRVAAAPAPDAGLPTPAALEWTRVALEPEGGMVPRRLEPGQEIAFVTPPITGVVRGVRYLVQATFASYGDDANVEGERVIRGRALSTPVDWTP